MLKQTQMQISDIPHVHFWNPQTFLYVRKIQKNRERTTEKALQLQTPDGAIKKENETYRRTERLNQNSSLMTVSQKRFMNE